jgi:DNA-binding HxlR family transcriptional regulator
MLDSTLIATSAIIRSLLEHPGQSKYSLAAELFVQSDVLERQLHELEDDGLIVTSQVDDEPVFWATEEGKQFGVVAPNGTDE